MRFEDTREAGLRILEKTLFIILLRWVVGEGCGGGGGGVKAFMYVCVLPLRPWSTYVSMVL